MKKNVVKLVRKTMTNYFCKTLRFFNLVDRSCNLSITNIAVIVLITKMAVSDFDWPTAAGLMVALLNYGHKRSETNKAVKSEQITTDILTSAVQAIEATKADLKALEDKFQATATLAEESKKTLSNLNLSMGFRPPVRNKPEPK